MPELWPFVLYALAGARITLFIAKDELIAEPRAWLLGKLEPLDDEYEPLPVAWWRRKLAYLITCIWCAPVWVAGAIVYPLWRWHHDNPAAMTFILVLAWAMAMSLLAKVGRTD